MLPIIATLRDIHQRRTAEMLARGSAARLRETNRLLLMAEELASLGHWTFEANTGQLLLSAQAATLLDLPQLELAPPEALALINHNDRRNLLRSLVFARRRTEPVEGTVRLTVGDRERTIHLRLQQSTEESGGLGLFGVLTDITDKLAAQRLLVIALEEARSAALFRSQFLATMSHEIRTPMTGVIGMIELLSGRISEAERVLYLDTLRQSGDVLIAVLNDILDFTKVDAGRLDINAEPFDLGQTLLTTVRLFDHAASSRWLHLRLDAPPPGEVWLRGDGLRLQQVVSNLLNNAIKFSERGEVVLRCSLQTRSGGIRALLITVEDKGIGIPADVQARLFEPFMQGSGANHKDGTGLGLAISRRLMGAMGGTVEVKSMEGQGSTFTIALEVADASPALPASSTATVAAVCRPLDLLLAEDNPVNQLLIIALLKGLGHQVTCAADGEIALLCANERRFDLILMDMQMPRRDGLSTTDAIRNSDGPNARTPIIALTADAAAGRRSLYVGHGISALLTKPISGAALSNMPTAMTVPNALPVTNSVVTAAQRAPLDAAILAEVGGMLGQARLDDLLNLLGGELHARPRAIREALADHDLGRAAAEADSLKGACANLGATRVASAAAALERSIHAAGEGDRSGHAPSLRSLAEAVAATQQVLAARHTANLLVAGV